MENATAAGSGRRRAALVEIPRLAAGRTGLGDQPRHEEWRPQDQRQIDVNDQAAPEATKRLSSSAKASRESFGEFMVAYPPHDWCWVISQESWSWSWS